MVKLKYISLLLFVFSVKVNAQLTGSFDTYASKYIDDDKIKLETTETNARLRANSYLKLDYRFSNFSTGIQIESYEHKALLNYSPKFEGTNLATYYLNYSNKKHTLDITVGHFYEKFGSGLIFRTWEDRPLGIANSLIGAKAKFKPINGIEITTLYGRQRNGFTVDLSESKIFGANTDIKISTLTKTKAASYGFGVSFINKNEVYQNVLSDVFLISNRGYFRRKGFNIDYEYVFKSRDALVEFGQILPEYQFDGDALLINTSYSKKGFGINANFRRTENFGFFSDRKLTRNSFNEALLNYIPAITKQFDYSLTNIYVYQSQPYLRFEPDGNKAGEIGGQLDAIYTIKKGTFLGGKSGMTLAANYSLWHGLAGRYDAANRKYKAEYLALGVKFYNDFSLEVRKNITKKWTSIFTYLNQYYNSKYVEESTSQVNTHTLVWDNQYNFSGSKTLKVELQHQWADANFKNWVAGLVEYNFNAHWSVFNNHLYNYGSDDVAKKIDYYTFGTTFSKNATRFQLSYGRQRGGLVCIGGVCRFVPESAGLTLGINYSF